MITRTQFKQPYFQGQQEFSSRKGTKSCHAEPIKQNNFPYPSAENLKAIAFAGSKERAKRKELYEKGDLRAYYELFKPQTPEEEEDFCSLISYYAAEKLGINMVLPSGTFGLNFQLALIEQLQLYKALNKPLPKYIGTFNEPAQWLNDNSFTVPGAVFMAYSHISAIDFNEGAVEAYRTLKTPEEKINNTMISNFSHEIGHLWHKKNDPEKFDLGFLSWLNEDERKTFNDFKTLYEANYDKIKWNENDKPSKNAFDINTEGSYSGICYPMQDLKNNWFKIYHTLKDSVKNKEPFTDDLIDKMDNVEFKLYQKMRKNLSGYASRSGAEAVAERIKVELGGKPLHSDTRQVLKELGKPDCPTMEYLPDDHPVMKLQRKQTP